MLRKLHKKRRIALIAHDRKKLDLIDWVKFNRETLSEYKLYGTGTTANLILEEAKNVIVIGGGDTACEEALYLSNICSSVTMLVRSSKMRASKIMQERVINSPKIKIEFSTVVEEILGDEIKANGVKTNKGIIECDGIFIAIGHSPNTELFKSSLIELDQGYIVTKPGTTHTDLPGVFACGDVQDRVYRQAITAAGTGCMAALDAERFLMENATF